MSSRFSLLLVGVILIFAISCRDNNRSLNNKKRIDKVVELQRNTKGIKADSLSIILRQTQAIMDQMEHVPDSIYAEQSFLKAIYFRENQKVDSALYYFKIATSILRDSITRKRDILYYQYLYSSYDRKGDYLNSLSIANKLEELLLNTEHYRELAYVYSYKRLVRIKLKNYQKALELNEKEISYFDKAKDTINVFASQIVRAKLMYDYLNEKEGAYLLLDSLKMNVPDMRYKNSIEKDIYLAYGVYKFYDKDYRVSYDNYLEALKFTKRTKDVYKNTNLGILYNNIAEVLMVLNKPKLGKVYIDSTSLFLNDLDIESRKFYMQIKLQLSHKLNNDFNEIYTDYDELFNYLNTSYEKRITTELNELNEANKKEKNLILTNQEVVLNNITLKRKQTFLFMLSALLFLSALISVLYYRQHKLKNEKEQIMMQQRLFRAQMNPHFTSNVLFSIQKLFSIDAQKANQYIVKFSRLLRLNLKNSLESFIPLEDELESVEKYLDLQLLRFPNRYSYTFEMKGFDEDTYYTIPPMIIQPFVENCVLHAFDGIDYIGEIGISLKVEGNLIQCTIDDNGVGYSKNKKNSGHFSMSTSLIKKLLKQMTKKDIDFINKRESDLGKGLLIKFYIPYRHD